MNVNWPLRSCRRWRRDLALLASGVLPEEERNRVQAHLTGCAECQRYGEELDRVAVNVQSLRQSSPGLEPSAALRARWTRAVRAEPQTDPLSTAVGALLAGIRAFAKRPVWAGLAGVWLLILFFRFTSPAVGEPPIAGPTPAPRELYLALRNPDWPRVGAAEEPANPKAKESRPKLLKPRSQHQRGIQTG